MVDRRDFLTKIIIGGIVAMVDFHRNAAAQDHASDWSNPYIPALQPLGTNPPQDPEQHIGDDLVLSSPKGTSPLEIMNYFAAISKTNAQGERFNAGWHERWNPVIVRFFECGGMSPSGDETPWCAACLNWVVGRSGLVGTCSSSSSSFKCVGKETQNPVPGDIVVFQHKNPQLAKAGRGHVGLFLSKTDGSIKVLGGNQEYAGHHAVCVQDIDGRVPLTLHSYRSIDSLMKLSQTSQICQCKPAKNRYCPS